MGMKQCIREAALLVIVMAGMASTGATAQDVQQQSAHSGTEHGSLGELGAKLSNPLGDVWALFTEFDLNWSEGNLPIKETGGALSGKVSGKYENVSLTFLTVYANWKFD